MLFHTVTSPDRPRYNPSVLNENKRSFPSSDWQSHSKSVFGTTPRNASPTMAMSVPTMAPSTYYPTTETIRATSLIHPPVGQDVNQMSPIPPSMYASNTRRSIRRTTRPLERDPLPFEMRDARARPDGMSEMKSTYDRKSLSSPVRIRARRRDKMDWTAPDSIVPVNAKLQEERMLPGYSRSMGVNLPINANALYSRRKGNVPDYTSKNQSRYFLAQTCASDGAITSQYCLPTGRRRFLPGPDGYLNPGWDIDTTQKKKTHALPPLDPGLINGILDRSNNPANPKKGRKNRQS